MSYNQNNYAPPHPGNYGYFDQPPPPPPPPAPWGSQQPVGSVPPPHQYAAPYGSDQYHHHMPPQSQHPLYYPQQVYQGSYEGGSGGGKKRSFHDLSSSHKNGAHYKPRHGPNANGASDHRPRVQQTRSNGGGGGGSQSQQRTLFNPSMANDPWLATQMMTTEQRETWDATFLQRKQHYKPTSPLSLPSETPSTRPLAKDNMDDCNPNNPTQNEDGAEDNDDDDGNDGDEDDYDDDSDEDEYDHDDSHTDSSEQHKASPNGSEFSQRSQDAIDATTTTTQTDSLYDLFQ